MISLCVYRGTPAATCRHGQTQKVAFRKDVMSFGIYLAGYVILIAGLIYGAVLMHVPAHWIAVGALVLVGLGVLTGVKATRQKDSAN
jgi:uncharacterized membrane protein YiaA